MNRTLAAVYATGLVIGVSYGLHGPILPIFAKNALGASYSELGLVGLANFVPYMFIPLLVGVLLDRFNNGYLLAAGSGLNAASMYLLSVAQSVPEVMGYRVLTGVAHAFFWPPCETIISSESAAGDRVRNISWFTMFFVVGFMAGPLAGSVMLDEFGATHRELFKVTALVLAASMAAALLAAKKGHRLSRERFSFAYVMEMRRFPEVIILLLFCTSAFGLVLTIYPAFLNDRGMSDIDILHLFFAFGVSRVVALALGGRLARSTGRTLVSAIVAVSAGLALSVFGDTAAHFVVSLLLMGFGFSVFFPLTLEIILSRTRGGMAGRMIGAYETIFGIGWAIGPAAGGPITQSLGAHAPYAVFGAIGVCVAVLAVACKKRLEPEGVRF